MRDACGHSGRKTKQFALLSCSLFPSLWGEIDEQMSRADRRHHYFLIFYVMLFPKNDSRCAQQKNKNLPDGLPHLDHDGVLQLNPRSFLLLYRMRNGLFVRCSVSGGKTSVSYSKEHRTVFGARPDLVWTLAALLQISRNDQSCVCCRKQSRDKQQEQKKLENKAAVFQVRKPSVGLISFSP